MSGAAIKEELDRDFAGGEFYAEYGVDKDGPLNESQELIERTIADLLRSRGYECLRVEISEVGERAVQDVSVSGTWYAWFERGGAYTGGFRAIVDVGNFGGIASVAITDIFIGKRGFKL